MKELEWVRGYQLVQSGRMNVRVSVVSDGEPTPAMIEPLVNALKGKLGSVLNVTIERVAVLRRGPSGKVPIVIQEGTR